MPAIVITGPESCGKTTLSRQLAEYFRTEWLPEFSRKYLENLPRKYGESDLLEIARGQVEAEKAFLFPTEELRLLDTSLEVLKIWSEVCYGKCHPFILQNLWERKHDLYLLCSPDVPWQYDPLREHPHDRAKLFKRYREELTRLNVNFVEISGLGEKRLDNAAAIIRYFLHKNSIPKGVNPWQ